ncbi:MAG: cellulose binding domain-containing protein [Actinomadura rubrobrunea]|nr:cellulose binding domain-containing protein [Actinomadura rubrobrunea]
MGRADGTPGELGGPRYVVPPSKSAGAARRLPRSAGNFVRGVKGRLPGPVEARYGRPCGSAPRGRDPSTPRSPEEGHVDEVPSCAGRGRRAARRRGGDSARVTRVRRRADARRARRRQGPLLRVGHRQSRAERRPVRVHPQQRVHLHHPRQRHEVGEHRAATGAVRLRQGGRDRRAGPAQRAAGARPHSRLAQPAAELGVRRRLLRRGAALDPAEPRHHGRVPLQGQGGALGRGERAAERGRHPARHRLLPHARRELHRRGAARRPRRYTVGSRWDTGFTATVTITNTGATINGWTLTFDLPAGQRVSQGWGAQWSQSGTTVTAENAPWNGTLAPGQSTSIGFNGTHTGEDAKPTAFTLNGSSCTTA